MNNLFEYIDILHSPVECFEYSHHDWFFPIRSHWHYYIELIYCTSGSVIVTCENFAYHLQPGDMVFIPPLALHSIFGHDKNEAFDITVVKFNPAKLTLTGDYLPNLNTLFKAKSLWKELNFNFKQQDFETIDLALFFEECVSEYDHKHYGYDSYLYSCLSGLMIMLLRKWFSVTPDLPDKIKKQETSEFSFADVLVYIDSHSDSNINIKELAEQCNMSYSYFAKTFKLQYGQSCKQYIESVRLSKVENLLLFTDYDLTYIAEETGFSDCSHLIRSFKRKNGTTPKQFRSRGNKPL